MEKPWQILEFYNSIGGMRYSLMRAGIHGEVIEAFEINDTASDVYEHNFGHRPFQAKRTLYFHNPFSIYKLQRTYATLVASENILSKNGHHFQDNGKEESFKPCEPRNFLEMEILSNHQFEHANIDACGQANVCMVDCGGDVTATATKVHEAKNMENISAYQSGDEVEHSGLVTSVFDKYIVPLSWIERWGSAMGFACQSFHGQNSAPTRGSLLATSKILRYRSTKKPEIHQLKELELRYFTPREVANLHSFPEDFNFPQHISIRQQYALLGNSLSIAVVASLFRYLFTGLA